MEPHSYIAHNKNKHPAVLRDENLCFCVPPMWFKNSVGLVIPIVTKKIFSAGGNKKAKKGLLI